jgi:hypothetical protein
MHRAFTRPIARTRSRAAVPAVLLLVAGVFAGTVAASPSGAAPPSAGVQTTLVLSDPTTDNTADLAGAPTDAIPAVLAQKNVTPILTTLRVSDGSELSKGTVITLTAVKADGVTKAGGVFTPAQITVDSRMTVVPIAVTYSEAAADIRIKAAFKKTNSTSPGPGLSETSFDVVDSLLLRKPTPAELATGFGARDCTSASTAKVCGFVILPNGIISSKAALSSGICATIDNCTAEEVQFIAGLDEAANRANPATLVLRCDKSKCGGKGVSNYTAKVRLSSSGDLLTSPPCPAKNTLPPVPAVPSADDPDAGHVCTDYVSSHRDNAGDLLLEVLFDKDMRGTM